MAESKKTIDHVIAEYVQATEEHARDLPNNAADEPAGTPVEDGFLARYPEFESELRLFFTMHRQMSGSSSDNESQDSDPSASELGPQSVSRDSSLLNELPRFLGEYEILEEIDRGGMGVVFKARHQQLNRVVALKLIRSGQLASQEELERFMSEARAAATLSHTGIVPIYEVGTWNGLVFYTMAYIEGQSLSALIADGPMDPMEAVRIVRKLCSAIEFAHRQGIYHRDLKPANILVGEDGEPIIIDFGLAKNIHHDDGLTASGQLLGTPAYIAPENASGRVKEIGPAADVYALGAILYCLCAGEPAFSGPTPFDVLLQVLDRRPPRPSKFNRRVSRSIDFMCLRMLEKDPAQRYPSIRDFATDLQHVLSGEPIDLPQESAVEQIQKWWQREPTLATHMGAIGATLLIVTIAYWMREETSTLFTYRVELLVGWMIISVGLQYWVNLSKWRDVAIFSWLAIDALMVTILISFASAPRATLLIGYPVLIVASGLFYRRRFVVATTLTSIACVLFLLLRFPQDDLKKMDFTAIYLSCLVIIGLCMLAVIRRIRGLSRYYNAD